VPAINDGLSAFGAKADARALVTLGISPFDPG
jgi:hypothetical protein